MPKNKTISRYLVDFNPNAEYEARRLRIERDKNGQLGKRSGWTKDNSYRWYPSENKCFTATDEELTSQMANYLPASANTNVKNSAKLAQWKNFQLYTE